MPEIPIRCKGTDYVALSDLQYFQGNLKELREAEYKKLRQSIEKYGFRFPAFVWQNHILDGHQRIFTLNKMLSEGWTIGPVPVVEIDAKDEREAKKLLLLVSSRYGHVTDEGLYEFISMNELDWEELKAEIDLPEIDLYKFEDGYFKGFQPVSEDEQGRLDEKSKVKCPECGCEFAP